MADLPWTDEHCARLLALGDSAQTGARWPKIGRELGRSGAACKWKYTELKRRIANGEQLRQESNKGTARRLRDQAATAAREQKLAAELAPRSLTAVIFGDPLPGRSALDRRQPEARTLPGIEPWA
jgi:hypothetical protein